MSKKIQYDEVVRNLIIYEYNSIINILSILYLHLMMTNFETYYKRKKLQIYNLEKKIKE